MGVCMGRCMGVCMGVCMGICMGTCMGICMGVCICIVRVDDVVSYRERGREGTRTLSYKLISAKTLAIYLDISLIYADKTYAHMDTDNHMPMNLTSVNPWK